LKKQVEKGAVRHAWKGRSERKRESVRERPRQCLGGDREAGQKLKTNESEEKQREKKDSACDGAWRVVCGPRREGNETIADIHVKNNATRKACKARKDGKNKEKRKKDQSLKANERPKL